MNQRDDLDRLLTAWLDDPFTPPAPRYLGEVLEQTRHTRQRRSWASLERWLPMAITLRRPMLAPPIRLLAIGLAMLLALLGAMALAPILSAPTRLSATTSTWSNGLIAYGAIGDIFVVDTPDGEPRVLIGGPTEDFNPLWSPDGSKLAFLRSNPAGGVDLMVANADGSDPLAVKHGDNPWVEWSPDGTRFAWTEGTTISIVASDGSGAEELDLGVSADFPVWHPSGQSLLFSGVTDAGVPGLYTVDLTTRQVTGPLVQADPASPVLERWGPQNAFWEPMYSPDGSRILYSTVIDLLPGQPSGGQNARARLVDADGSNDHEVAYAADSWYETAIGWAPDGNHYALRVVHGGPDRAGSNAEPVSVAIASADGDSATVLTEPATGWADGSVWSPDGSAVLAWGGGSHSKLIDASTGATIELPWGTTGHVDWQPIAP